MGFTARINGPTRLHIASGVYFSPATDDGCVLLNLEQGTILSLNGSGALMLSKLAESNAGLTRDELVEAVMPEFEEVEGSRIETAVDDLLKQLHEKRALQQQGTDLSQKSCGLRARLAQIIPSCTRGALMPVLFINAYTVAALFLLLTADGILKLGGFNSLHRTVRQWALAVKKQPDSSKIVMACAAVNRACTWHPKRALCLQRAAVLVCLLRSLGVPAEMMIGVHKMPFYGHAWAEVDGIVVNDHENAQKFFQTLSRC
jgi:hypothetical protein